MLIIPPVAAGNSEGIVVKAGAPGSPNPPGFT